ncbi:MAG: alpha/beta-hydrolase family protein, partial [Acidimicrobiia bacterium]|nr:alpha/beta-hydrolase family protein [Acidimicrobiia bacterium]
RRCRAFERSILVAACPAGTGYVNFIAAETVEYMTGGDCAVVAVQYGSLPSMLSLDKVPIASATYRKLLVACREEIDLTGSPTRLVAYGESLGALAGESGLRTATDDGTLVTDRALWVGTPVGSLLFDRLVADGTPVFDSPADLDGREAGAITFLNHDNDPVTKFEPAIAYRMPGWMEPKDRGRGTDPAQRWIPGVAFFQGLIDTKNAATVVPGEFKSSGHDYRADLASMIRFAYDLDVDETTMTAIEDALRRSEVERSTSIALGRLGTG